MTQVNVYLHFDGNCGEAMTFYKECLGGELTLQKVKESPIASQWPANVQDDVLHASLVNKGIVLLGSDMPAPDGRHKGNTISLSLNCETEEEINTYFAHLSAGAVVSHPLHDFFAGKLGALTDKFGKTWMFHYNKGEK